jgi:hypothetical protein
LRTLAFSGTRQSSYSFPSLDSCNHGSWVDLQKIRQALSGKKRGDQAAPEHMRCVDQSTVSTWRATLDVMEAIDGKCEISHLSSFWPSHATEIARAYRR